MLFQSVGGGYYWYQNDHLGTPQKMVDTSGGVVWSAAYDAFGRIQILVVDVENNLRLAGQYYDEETGLHYNLNRYYDPVIGRYMRVDPVGDGLNLYAYCYNDPINWVDPYGLCGENSFLPKDPVDRFLKDLVDRGYVAEETWDIYERVFEDPFDRFVKEQVDRGYGTEEAWDKLARKLAEKAKWNYTEAELSKEYDRDWNIDVGEEAAQIEREVYDLLKKRFKEKRKKRYEEFAENQSFVKNLYKLKQLIQDIIGRRRPIISVPSKPSKYD